MTTITLGSITNQLQSHLTNVRRELHANPELSNQEIQTTERLKRWLEDAGIKVLKLPLKTGLIAEISGDDQGPVIAIRADIDALPIEEQTDLPYKSTNAGVMHACGHDFHATTILGAAYLLQQNKEKLKGTVRVIFQPAEETGHGARDILKTNVLSDVSAIFGLHNATHLKVGQFSTKAGTLTAGVDRFEINIKGKGAHAARPFEGIDPVIVAADIITTIQTIISREIPSSENVVISVTQIHSGTTWNVIPETAYLEGTVRTLDKKVRSYIPEKIERIINGVAATHQAEVTLLWHPGPPSVNNDDYWAAFTKRIASKHRYEVLEATPSSGGEDFSFYQENIRGAFVHIGVSGDHALHHPKYTLDESALEPASIYFANLAVEAIEDIINQK